jgi:hypothetical protein
MGQVNEANTPVKRICNCKPTRDTILFIQPLRMFPRSTEAKCVVSKESTSLISAPARFKSNNAAAFAEWGIAMQLCDKEAYVNHFLPSVLSSSIRSMLLVSSRFEGRSNALLHGNERMLANSSTQIEHFPALRG